MKSQYKVENYWFTATGRESNWGFEYEVRRDMGDAWYQSSNTYFRDESEMKKFFMRAKIRDKMIEEGED